MGFLRLLRRRHLAILWLSQVLSAIGDNLYAIAVVWLAVQVAGSGAGLVVAAQSISALAFGLLGGVFADRWDRRRTMMAVDLARGVAVAVLPVLAWLDMLQLWHMAAVAVVIGGLGALFDPALLASLPALTGDAATLQAANGLMDITRRLARALGPGLVGVLVALLPVAQFFTLDAVSFAISAGAVYALGRGYAWRPRAAAGARGAAGVLHEIGGALRLVRAHRPLTWALAGLGVSNIAWSTAFIVGVPLLAERELAGSIGAFGLIVGAYGAANVVGNLIIGSLAIKRRALVLFSGRVVLGGGFLILAVAHNLPLAMLGSGLAALGGPIGDLMMLTMIQTDFATDQIGKVFALRMTTSSAGVSLGLLLAVPLFAHLSIALVIAASRASPAPPMPRFNRRRRPPTRRCPPNTLGAGRGTQCGRQSAAGSCHPVLSCDPSDSA